MGQATQLERQKFPMNLILFELAETTVPLSRNDPRAQHILDVLRREIGDTFDAGLVNGRVARPRLSPLKRMSSSSRSGGRGPGAPRPVTLVIGLPRPRPRGKYYRKPRRWA